ncbi:MAG: argininosuccinate lyase [Deltaproteobacteria bacterium]|nr:argininosuccinate lyase [Deltaproteobacteria bacterium]
MNASVAFDRALAIEDIAGSIAHARMLLSVGVLSHEEWRAIEDGLTAIAADVREGRFVWSVEREDVHMNVEGALAERIGEAAGRLHTGRSRNDQVALDLRLWLRRELSGLGNELARTVFKLLELSGRWASLPMPGYTHLQRAQPITLGHHLMAWASMLLRDIDRLLDARKRLSWSPLGSGALAGTTLPIDRFRVARELELDGVTINSLDGVADRDGALESLATLSILMVHVSRMAEELVLWTSQEFGFVELSDAFCTGSSLMPQKKNPDIPELMRGKAGRVFGALQALLVTMKGLPLAYNKDMQEDKEPLFDAMRTARQCAAILPELLGAITPRPERMKRALEDGYLLATDLADYLVQKGVPFREAHHVAGRAVAEGIKRDVRLEAMTLEDLKKLHSAFEADVSQALDVGVSLDKRHLPGGPAPAAVETAMTLARQQLEELGQRLAANGPSLLERALHAGDPLPPPI